MLTPDNHTTPNDLETAHLEKRYGTAKQAAHYCAKPVAGCHCEKCEKERENPTQVDGPWEYGVMSQQGQRADLLECQRDIDRGKRMCDIAKDEFPTWVKFHKGFGEYRRLTTKKREEKPEPAEPETVDVEVEPVRAETTEQEETKQAPEQSTVQAAQVSAQSAEALFDFFVSFGGPAVTYSIAATLAQRDALPIYSHSNSFEDIRERIRIGS